MKKEELMKIEGMTEELAQAVEKLSAEELKEFVPKYRFDEVNDAKNNAESLVKERDNQLADLKKSVGDNEELKNQIETLQNDNKAAKAEYEANIRSMRLDNAINLALTGAGAKNNAAARALLKDMDKAKLLDDGTVEGLADQIKGLQKSDAYLFNSTEPPKPVGATPPASNPNPTGASGKSASEMTYEDFCNQFNN